MTRERERADVLTARRNTPNVQSTRTSEVLVGVASTKEPGGAVASVYTSILRSRGTPVGERERPVQDSMSRISGIMSMVQPVTRRQFLKRSSAIVVAVPAVASLLAACGGDDDDEPTPVPPTPTQGSVPTPGPAGQTPTTAAQPTPTTAAATPTSGAAPTATTAPEPTPTPAGETPVMGGTIVTQGHQEISSLHPDDAGPYVHYVIVRNIHEPLIDLDIDYTFIPVLAESYEAAEDALSYRFKIHEGVTFHDGTELTSADVKYNFDWYRDPASAAVLATDHANVEEVIADDDYTVTVKMKAIDAAFLANMTGMLIVPKHIHEVGGKDAYSPKAMGTGPFMLKEWKAAEQTTLVKYVDYWQGEPYVDAFREDIVPEGSVRAVRLETGEADNSVWPLQAQDNLRFINELSDRFDVNRAPGIAVNHFPLNNEKPALADKIVRQAMLTAIDRDSLINDLEKGLSVKAHSNYSPAIQFYYNDNVKKYDYDPEAAIAMLEEAGYVLGPDGIREKDGVKLSFTCTVITGDQRRRPEAEVVQQNLKAVGIDMQIQEAPVATILEQLPAGQMDASLFNWTYGGAEPDARTVLRSDAAQNWSHYKNPEMDALLDAGVATIVPEERQKIYHDIQALVAEDVPFLYIQFWEDIQIWNKRVKGRPAKANNPAAIYPLIRTFWKEEE